MASTEFTLDIDVGGGSAAESAAAAVMRLSDSLKTAQAATIAANEAVKSAEGAYKKAESSAISASKSLEKLNDKQAEQRAELAKLEAGTAAYDKAAAALEKINKAQATAAEKAARAAAAVKDEGAALDKLKSAAEQAAKTEEKVSDALDQAKLEKGSGKVNEMGEAFGKLGGPLGALGQKAFGAADGMKKLSSSLGSAGPYAAIAIAVVAIVAGIAALGVAAAGATVHIAAWAVGLADAARTQGLLAAGVAQSVKGGSALQATIDDITSRVPTTADELLALAKPLADAGLQGDELAKALEDAAVKAAKVKFGPDFAKQMNSLPSLTARLQSNFSKLFGGLKIEKLLDGLGKMVGLFDATSVTGNAIKVLFESLFQPLIDATTGIIPKLISGFIQLEIMVMKGAIQMKAIWKEWGTTITYAAAAVGIVAAVITGVLLAAIAVVVISLSALAFAVGVVVGAVTALVAGVVWLGAQFVAFGSVLVQVGEMALGGLKAGLQLAIDWLSSLSFTEIGMNLINGLIAGITGAGPGVLTAITGIADGAINAAKSALGIASPSKVFAEIGMHTAAGMEEGVDGGSSAVASSMEAMVEPPTAPSDGAGMTTTTSVNSGGNVYHATFNLYGSAAEMRDAIDEYFTSMAAQAGTAVPAT